MSIDYERQFKELTFDEARQEQENWRRERTYTDAKTAFISAKRSEDRGQSVAFAKLKDRSVYWVWVGRWDER